MPLNNELYRYLQLAVNSGNLPGTTVKISKENQPMTAKYVRDTTTGRYRLIATHPGEEYRVCCPDCDDHRYRLHINHRWGVYDPKTKSRNRWLIHCYHKNCESRYGFSQDILQRIDPVGNRLRGARVSDLPRLTPANTKPAPLPKTVPMNKLDPEHPASQLMLKRGFNLEKLSKHWDIGWCEDHRIPTMRNRIVVPFYMDHKVVGWQARYVGTDGDNKNQWLCGECGQEWYSDEKPEECDKCNNRELDKVAKWYTGYNTKTGETLFNYDNASAWPYVVLCEGPLDVIRLGTPKETEVPGPGVAVFGHSLSYHQKHLILRRPSWVNGTVFLCFDDELWDDDAESERLMEIITSLRGNVQNIIPVFLPKHKDPGDLTHPELWGCIRQAAENENIKVEW